MLTLAQTKLIRGVIVPTFSFRQPVDDLRSICECEAFHVRITGQGMAKQHHRTLGVL